MTATVQGFPTVNPIATIVPPSDAQAQPKAQPIADAAHTLCAQFAVAESTQARTRSVWDMARTLTCAEFDTAMSEALKLAAANDKVAGWVPPSDAKGRGKYGPTQSTLATVASQCRQVFGACKIDPEVIVTLPQSGIAQPDLFPNWSRAVTLARDFLEKQGVDWQGNNTESVKQARADKQATAANAGCLAEVMSKNPQQPGETMSAYMERIAPMVEAEKNNREQTAIADAGKKEFTRLVKVYGASARAVILAALALADAADGEESPM